jgi:hypothetical protein
MYRASIFAFEDAYVSGSGRWAAVSVSLLAWVGLNLSKHWDKGANTSILWLCKPMLSVQEGDLIKASFSRVITNQLFSGTLGTCQHHRWRLRIT